MAKLVVASIFCAALAFDDFELDGGLSLLQMRANKGTVRDGALAAAFGVPHLTTNSGKHFDLDIPALVQMTEEETGAEQLRKADRLVGDGSTLAANGWTEAHSNIGIGADARVGRSLFVETCMSESSFPDTPSFRTYLNDVFDLGLAMMLPTVKSDLGRHCFSYGYILSKEFYGDAPLDVLDLGSGNSDSWSAVAKDAEGRVQASAFKASMHSKHDPGHSAEEVAAFDIYLDKCFATGLSMMLPDVKTTLGSHCFGYAAMAAGEFYFSGVAQDAFGLVAP